MTSGARTPLGDLHYRSDELEALSDALDFSSIIKLTQVSYGWRKAALAWMSCKSAVVITNLRHSLAWYRSKNLHGVDPLNIVARLRNREAMTFEAALRYVTKRCHGLRSLVLYREPLLAGVVGANSEPFDLAVLSLNCPATLERLHIECHPQLRLPSKTLPSLARSCLRLRHVRLNCKIVHESDILGFVESCAESLESLDLGSIWVGNGQPQSSINWLRILAALTAHCKSLRTLVVPKKDGELMFKETVGVFSNLQRLVCPNLYGSELRCALKLCPRLEELDSSRCNDFPQGVGETLTSVKIRNLPSFEVSNADLHSIMLSCPRLEHLDLNGNRGSATDLHGGVPTLVTLNVRECNLTDAALTAVVNRCPLLRELDISCCPVTVIKGPQLVKLRASRCSSLLTSEGSLDQLQDLVLENSRNFKSLASSCISLRTLNVSGCVALETLPLSLPVLRVLDAADCQQLDPQSAHNWPMVERMVLKRVMWCQSPQGTSLALWTASCARLQNLDVSWCRITDDCVSSLALHCPRLNTLNVHMCWNLTAISVDVIKRSFPSLRSLTLLADRRLLEAAQDLCAARPHLTENILMNGGRDISSLALNMKLVTQDGNEIFFKCKYTTPLQKVMTAFCNRQGVAMNSVRFLFDGSRISSNQTPFELRMEDGDVVDVMIELQNVGEWEAPTGATMSSTGQALLQGNQTGSVLTGDEVVAIERTATGPSLSPPLTCGGLPGL